MNTEWQSFLNDAGVGSDLLLPPDGQAFCGLSRYGLLKVSGEDAAAFLQGQATCDVNAVNPGHSGTGAFCTPQGRVIANFRLLREELGFYLLLAADLAETVRKRLQIYVLRSKVTLENLTPRYGMIGLFGIDSNPVPETSTAKIPASPGTWLGTPDSLALRLENDPGRGLIAAATDIARQLWAGFSEELAPVRDELWRLKEIEAGFPEITAATSEEFLPQMLNLDAFGGISFQKGCYTGQEIVTRTHYLGRIKRRMFRLRCGNGIEPAPGALIYEASEAEPKSIGHVVVAAPESALSHQLLAVLELEHAGSANLHVGRPDGPAAELLPLPYGSDSPYFRRVENQHPGQAGAKET